MECARTNEEKEKYILKNAVENAEKKTGIKQMKKSKVNVIIKFVEEYIRKKNLVCYGGIAINNILPKEAQFYDYNSELPDYDFFSPNAQNDVIDLANKLYDAGFENVEAKSGMHKATYRLYVDYFQVADVTNLDKKVFNSVRKNAIVRKGILYAPPNLLRMMSYTELSRPNGQVSRWEKVMSRLILLNKYFPIKNKRCHQVNFQRDFDSDDDTKQDVYFKVRNTLIDEGVVFFGGWATSLYSRYMPETNKRKLEVELPDFDVISEDPETTLIAVKDNLRNSGYKSVKIKKHSEIKDILPYHYEIIVNGNSICFIYKNEHCYSYNTIKRNNRGVKIATMDTILKFYLAFIYCGKKYYDVDRLLCMAFYLLKLQQKNKFAQKGLLKRFTIQCYGEEKTVQDTRSMKNEMFQKLKHNKKSKEYKEHFLKYVPKGKLQRKIARTRKRKMKGKKKADTKKNSNWFGF